MCSFSARKIANTTDPLCSKQFLIVLPTLSRNATDTSAVKNKINSFHENVLEKGLKFCLTMYGCVLNYQTYIAWGEWVTISPYFTRCMLCCTFTHSSWHALWHKSTPLVTSQKKEASFQLPLERPFWAISNLVPPLLNFSVRQTADSYGSAHIPPIATWKQGISFLLVLLHQKPM